MTYLLKSSGAKEKVEDLNVICLAAVKLAHLKIMPSDERLEPFPSHSNGLFIVLELEVQSLLFLLNNDRIYIFLLNSFLLCK